MSDLHEDLNALAELGVRENWPPDEWRAGIRALLAAHDLPSEAATETPERWWQNKRLEIRDGVLYVEGTDFAPDLSGLAKPASSDADRDTGVTSTERNTR